MKIKQIPNLITIARLLLLFPFAYYLLQARYTTAFLLFLLAGFTDALDGLLARAFAWTSRLGAFLDPLADKLLMFTSFCGLMWLGHIPLWLFVLVIARDLVIMGGVMAVSLLCEQVEFKPTLISKLNTGLQIAFVLAILFGLAFFALPDLLIQLLLWSMVLTTVSSVLVYVYLGINQALTCP